MFIHRLLEKGELSLPNEEIIKVEGHLSQLHKLQSQDQYSQHEWSLDKVKMELDSNFKGNHDSKPQLMDDLPVYPNSDRAIRDVLFEQYDYNDLYGKIYFIFPNYTGRIERVEVGKTRIRAFIDCTNIGDLRIGYYVSYHDSNINSTPQPINSAEYSIQIDGLPEMFSIYLIERDNTDIVDWKYYYHHRHSNNIIFEFQEDQLSYLIEGGESEEIEFKLEIGKNEEFVESVVAFSNSNGGTIIIGVDDNGKIVGKSNKDSSDRITKIIRSHCNPMPKVKIEDIVIEDMSILLVIIEEGENKPYILKDRGIYIRAQSTDRIANRAEIDDMYTNRNSVIRQY